nr:hypothetical protein BaRGS_007909 [Batillaria attramentaria]
MPGMGWDNLRNLDQGQVVSFNYSKCRTTDDGRFLLPDSVTAVSIKSSRIVEDAKIIDHYQVQRQFGFEEYGELDSRTSFLNRPNTSAQTLVRKHWKSLDARSINTDVSFGLAEFVELSGAYSSDYRTVKEKQIQDRSVTVIAEVRYISCSAGNPFALTGNAAKDQFENGDAEDWPHRCPEGYSRHIATIDQGCEVKYCVRIGAFSELDLPSATLPPFMKKPPLTGPPEDDYVFDSQTRSWIKNKTESEWEVVCDVGNASVGSIALVLGCLVLLITA